MGRGRGGTQGPLPPSRVSTPMRRDWEPPAVPQLSAGLGAGLEEVTATPRADQGLEEPGVWGPGDLGRG